MDPRLAQLAQLSAASSPYPSPTNLLHHYMAAAAAAQAQAAHAQAQAAQANERRTKTPLLPQPPPRMACGSLYSIPFPLIWESPYLLPSHPKLPWPFDAFGGTWNSDHYIQDSQ